MNHDKISFPPPIFWIHGITHRSEFLFHFFTFHSVSKPIWWKCYMKSTCQRAVVWKETRSKRPIKLIISKQPRFFSDVKDCIILFHLSVDCFIGGYVLGCVVVPVIMSGANLGLVLNTLYTADYIVRYFFYDIWNYPFPTTLLPFFPSL